jgi:hypothetical protein
LGREKIVRMVRDMVGGADTHTESEGKGARGGGGGMDAARC